MSFPQRTYTTFGAGAAIAANAPNKHTITPIHVFRIKLSFCALQGGKLPHRGRIHRASLIRESTEVKLWSPEIVSRTGAQQL